MGNSPEDPLNIVGFYFASLAHFHSPCIVKLDDFIDLQELVSSAAQPEQPAAGLVLLELQLMFVGSVDIRLQRFC